MGLFKKDEVQLAQKKEAFDVKRQEFAAKKHEKAKTQLLKRGIDLDGLVMLDDSFDDGAYEYLLIFPDRVEHVNTGKVGTITKKGKGSEVIPMSRISAVQTRKKMIFEIIEISASGSTIEFKSSPGIASTLKETILNLMAGSSHVATAGTTIGDPTEQLVRLADLHKAGVLTDQEFADKKAELLKRI